MPAGELRERVAFYLQAESPTSYGIAAGEWDLQFTVAARIKPLLGSEPVLAQRRQGIQPVVITIRANDNARRIDSSWQARDARTGVQYQILNVPPSERRDIIDILAESGVAQ